MASQQQMDRYWDGRSQSIGNWHRAAAQLTSAGPVLDLGGGDGTFAKYLASRGIHDITVADISEIGVQAAKAKGFKSRRLDLRELPLPWRDNEFATVTLIEVIEHAMEPQAILKEALRVGTSVVLTVPNFSNWKERATALTGRVPFQHKPQRGGHIYWFNRSTLREVVREAGGTIEQEILLTPTRPPKGLWTSLGKALPNLLPVGYTIRCKRDHGTA